MTETPIIPYPLQKDEHIIITLRRHWIVVVFQIGYGAVLLMTLIVLWNMYDIIVPLLGTAIVWGFFAVYKIIYITAMLISWISHELNIVIITNMRIISINRVSLFSHRVSECSLSQVQEVNAQHTGILQTIFHYGQVRINTASESSSLIIKYTNDPVENANKINTLITDFRSSQGIKK